MSKKKNTKGVPVRKNSPSRASKVRSAPVAKKRPSPAARSRADAAMAQRHALYKRMLRAQETTKAGGFCYLLRYMGEDYHPDRNLTSLPELYSQKPVGESEYLHWWTPYDWKPRRAALRAAIKASAPKK